MKKTYILLLLNLIVILPTLGQINPINNLSWQHTYEYPNNCFSLYWSEPDLSLTDTLVGYNIYRDDRLYSFTNDLQHNCNPCFGIADESFCDFLDFPGKDRNFQFYIHVTAVYNHNHIESIYTESSFNGGIYVGIKDLFSNKALKVSTFIQEKSSMKVEFNQIVENGTLIITTLTGQIARILPLKNQNSIDIGISNYNTGIYFLLVKTSKEYLACKILLK